MTAAPAPAPKPKPPQGRGRIKNLPDQYRNGLIEEIIDRAKNVWALFMNPKVRLSSKFVLVVVAIYAILPDFVPGPFDDVIVIYFGVEAFENMAARDLAAAGEPINSAAPDAPADEEDFVVAEVREVPPES